MAKGEDLEILLRNLECVDASRYEDYTSNKQLRRQAAVLIQSSWRGYLARKITYEKPKVVKSNPAGVEQRNLTRLLTQIQSVASKRTNLIASSQELADRLKYLESLYAIKDKAIKSERPDLFNYAQRVENYLDACINGTNVDKIAEDKSATEKIRREHRQALQNARGEWWKGAIEKFQDEDALDCWIDGLCEGITVTEPRCFQ